MSTLVITGASKGIGFEIAKTFLADRHRVINLSRSPAPDESIENHGVDLSKSDIENTIADLIATILQHEKICLVHNAAKLTNDRADVTTTADFKHVLSINLVAPHILNQAIIPLMQPGSSIIYIGSTLSTKAVANSYSYVVSKHALVGMMRATCQDLIGRQIHTCCICPGFTDTEMLRVHIGDEPGVFEQIASASTFGRLIDSEEIAATVKFAAANPVINGAVLHANLGQVES